MAGHPQISPATPIGIDLTGLAVNDQQGQSYNVVSLTGGGTFKVSSVLNIEGFLAAFFVGAASTLPVTITYYYESLGGGPEGTLGAVTTTLGATHNTYPLPGGIVLEQYTDVTAYSTAVTSLMTPGVYEITARASVLGLFGPMNAFTSQSIMVEVIA